MMEKEELTQKISAGLFFVIGLLLIFFFIFILGRDKGLAQAKFQVEVLYRNVGGLMEGAPARLAGVNVGTVAGIDFLDREIDERRVKVTINILQKYRRQLAGQSLTFAIKTEGILGEKLIEMDVVQGGLPVDLSRPVIGEDPLDVQDLAEVFARAAESFTKTADQLSQIDIVGLTDAMGDSSQALLTTSEGINEMMDELQEIVRKSKRLLDRVEQRIIDGNLFKVF